MSEPIDSLPRPPIPPLVAALQILGFAGSSHLLHQAVARLPGYPTSDLANTTTLFTSATPQDLADALVLFALVPALLEELLFRGLLFAILVRLRGPAFAVGISALLFGIAHLDPHHGAVAALLGVQLGLLRLLYGLPFAITAHLLNNVLALSATFPGGEEGHGLPAFEAGAVSLTIAFLLSGSAWATLVQRLRSSPDFARGSGSGLQTPRE